MRGIDKRFSEKEEKQIAGCFKKQNLFHDEKLDRRRVSYEVFKYLKIWGLIQKGKDLREWNGERPNFVKSKDLKRWFIVPENNFTLYEPWNQIPVGSLWYLVSPMIPEKESIGFSITKNKKWLDVIGREPGTYCFNSQYEQSIKEIMFILGKLSSHCFIWFQHAGNIWRIERRDIRIA